MVVAGSFTPKRLGPKELRKQVELGPAGGTSRALLRLNRPVIWDPGAGGTRVLPMRPDAEIAGHLGASSQPSAGPDG